MFIRLDSVVTVAPLVMALTLFVAAMAHLTEDPHAAGLVLVFYVAAWIMAPKLATVIALLTTGYVIGLLFASI